MKYLPHITGCIWLILIVGYLYAPDFTLQPLVKFPVVIILSVFLTVSFWILQKDEKRGVSLIFIGIFLFNVGMPLYASVMNHKFIQAIDQETEKGIAPELAELLSSGDTEQEREMAAKIIYTTHGISLPYKTLDERFAAYSPNKTDKDQYLIAHEQRIKAEMAIKNLKAQIEASNFLVGLQLALFLTLLIFLLLYDRPGSDAGKEKFDSSGK